MAQAFRLALAILVIALYIFGLQYWVEATLWFGLGTLSVNAFQ
jgi:hypothetical protein